MDYGKRICLVCGKEFNATYIQQLTCSSECKYKRKIQMGLISQRLRRSRIRDHYEKLETDNEILKTENENLLAINQELADKIEGMAGAATPELQPCLRCNVKALNLPCGKNEICWQPEPCEKCKGMAKPSFDERFAKAARPRMGDEDGEYFEKFRTVE